VDGSHVASAGGSGILVNGSSATISSPVVTGAGADGITLAGGSAIVSSPDISGSHGDGVRASGSGASISGGKIHGNSANGVHVLGSNDSISHVVFFGNGGKPIANEPGANGGIVPPANLRIGPRRADGTLPLTGTSTGTVELWSGDPSSANAPSFLDAFSTGGDFTYNFRSEPQPGSVFAVSLTNAGQGTSEFETVAVPQDVVSPDVTFSRALDTNNVRVDFTEPLDPGSVQPSDFALNMAGADRAIAGATVAPDGLSVTLASSGWKAGEAGYVTIAGPGAVNDVAGNAMLSAPRIRVAAAPGDFISPLGGKLAVTPKTICLTHGRGCRHTGMTIRFTTTEPGKATLVIKRSDVTVGKRLYGNVVAGTNTLKWNGRLGSRKLRAGRYRLLMYVQDQVGNITDQPPIVLFSVRRVSK
jgi:Right handed beta helix region